MPHPAKSILIASHNAGKLREMKAILSPLGIAVVSAAEAGLWLEVVEDGATYAENAAKKARAFAEASGLPALADDSGLEVDALGGEPGLHSARWLAGADEDRVEALLRRLADEPDASRTARFVAVTALAVPLGDASASDEPIPDRRPVAGLAEKQAAVSGETEPRTVVTFGRGELEGRIAKEPHGDGGFGYDPVFLVTEAPYRGLVTLAELPEAEKNRLSHRAKAVRALMGQVEFD